MKLSNDKPYLYKKVFASLGEISTYEKLRKKGYLSRIVMQQCSDIKVELHESILDHPRRVELVKIIERILRENFFTDKYFKIPVSINTICTTFFPLCHAAKLFPSMKQEWFDKFIERMKKIDEDDGNLIISFFVILIDRAIIPITDFRNILIYFDLNVLIDEHKKPFWKITLKAKRAQIREFDIDNNPRKAFRIGFSNGLEGLVWQEMTVNGNRYPVYIQSHAIDALEKRVDCLKFYVLRDSISLAIKVGEMISFEGTNLLSFSWRGFKLGYFVCSFVSECILIKTFLFLTNDGTPEGEKINDAFGLEKQGKKYLEIDKLSSFIMTDIHRDKGLKETFSRFGVGHLFGVLRDDAIPQGQQRAEDLKRILCLS